MTRIIRSSSTVVRADRLDETREAGAVLRKAEAEARAILDRANERARAEGAAAAERGYEDGLSRGRAEAVAVALRTLGGDAGHGVADLALAAAAEIVRGVLEDDPAKIERIVADALARTSRRRALAITLHPDDAGALGTIEGAEVRTDPSFLRGSVVVESRAGRVDGRLEVRLEALRAALAKSENFLK
jgi:type III secretion protein L